MVNSNNQNDIVITAQAGTKQAEANVQELDAKIKALTAQDTKLKQFGRDLLGVSSDAQAATKAMGAGFATLQGSFTGVITKLGAVGLAIGGLKKAWDLAQSEQQRYIDSMRGQADAAGKSLSVLKDSTKSILDNLEKFDKLADGGYLDNTAIEQTNSLVSQLNDLWGDVGISVDQATGKVNGLKEATQKITGELKAMALEQLALEEKVAQSEYDKAESDYSWWYDEDGKLHNEAMGMLIAGNWTGNGDTYKAELDNKRKTAKANLLAVQQRRKQLESSTTVEDINNSIAAAEAAKQKEVEAQKAQEQAQTEFNNRLAAENKRLKPVDYQEEKLKQDLAIAQANGGDVAGARAALDSYTQQRDMARFRELEQQMPGIRDDQYQAKKDYDLLQQNDASDEEILAALEVLNNANERLTQATNEMAQLGTRLEQVSVEEPKTEIAAIARTMSNGTFNSYGISGLTQNTIEQQQLEVQKQIAKNTENLNVPIVGE